MCFVCVCMHLRNMFTLVPRLGFTVEFGDVLDRQTDRQTNRQTVRQTDRESVRSPAGGALISIEGQSIDSVAPLST